MKILFLSNNETSHPLFKWIKEKENIIYYEEKLLIESLKKYNPKLIISYNYRYIINKEIINFVNNRIINLHISLLPWNRGSNPNMWSFLEETPKGVTIHEIDEGIDTGNIYLQKEITFDEKNETLLSSYRKLHSEIQNLFKEHWKDILNDKVIPTKQYGKGTYHNSEEGEVIKKIIQPEGWNIKIPELKRRYDKWKLK